MAEDLQTTISVLAETGQATSNLGRLDQAFKKFFDDAGKTPAEAKAFLKLAKDVEQGRVAIESLDKETRGLVETFLKLREVGRARDKLELIPHAKIKAQIADLRAAFETLRNSGKLSQDEIAQAAKRLEQQVGALKAHLKETGDTTSGIGAKFGALRATVIGIAAAVGGFVLALGRATQAASEQELAEAKLEQVIKRVNGEGDAQVKMLTEQASALQKTTAFGDEQIINSQALLGTFKLNADAIAQLTPRMLDMATAMEKTGGETLDLKGVSVALGKALTDGLGSLKRYGVSMTDAEERAFDLASTSEKVAHLTKILDGNFKGLAQTAGKTFSGQLRIARNEMGEVLEGLGNAVIKNTEVKAALNGTISTLRGWAAALRANGEAIKSFVSGVVGLAGAAASAVGSIGAFVAANIKLIASLTALAFFGKLTVLVYGFGVAIAGAATKVVALTVALGRLALNPIVLAVTAAITAFTALADRINAARAATEEYAKLQKLLKIDPKDLSNKELEEHRVALEGVRDTTLAAATEQRDFVTWLLRGSNEQEKNAAAALEAADALIKVTVAQKLRNKETEAAAEALKKAQQQERGLSDGAAELIDKFTKLRTEGKGVEEAIKAVFESFKPENVARVLATGGALRSLGQTGAISAKQLGEAWDEAIGKLSSRQLIQFAAAAEAAFTDVAEDAETLATINEKVLLASFKALGVDAEKSLTGISAAASDTIGHFSLLASSGKLSAKAIEDAFDEALKKLDSPEAIQAMIDAIQRLGKEGKLSVAQVTEQVEKLNERAAELTPGIQSATEAYKQLGIEAPAALQKTADKAREAFEVIRDSGAGIEEIRRAFLAYAKAALAAAEASGKPVSGLLAAQAAALGLKDEFAKLEKQTEKLSGSLDTVARANDQAAKAAEAHTKSVEAEGRAAIATAQAELEKAKARGNALEITRATIALAETESAVAAKVAEAKLAEAAAADQKVLAIEREAQADGVLTEAEREVLAVAQEVAAAKLAEADAAQASADAKAIEATARGKAAEAEQGIAVSIEAALAFQRERIALTEQFGDAAAKVYDQVALGLEAAHRGENGLIELTAGLLERLRRDSAEAAGEILGLTAKLSQAETPTESLTQAAAQALEKYRDLGDEALAGLRKALDDAKQRTEALRDAAADTLEQLRDQFDQLKGNDEAIAAREYQRKKAELEAQLKEAQASGDRQAQKDLQEALRLLTEIRAERERQRVAEAKADAARKKSAAEKKQDTAAAGGDQQTQEPPAFGRGAQDRPATQPRGRGDFKPTFNLYGSDLSENNVRRNLMPILEKIWRQEQ